MEDAKVKARSSRQARDGQGASRRAARDHPDGRDRLVVSKGEIEAASSSRSRPIATASPHEDQKSTPSTRSSTPDPPLSGCSAGERQRCDLEPNIQVNTPRETATDDLTASINGQVKIEFATGLFQARHFASMYAGGS